MRRKEIWKKRLYKAAALGMALSMLAGSPMAALAGGEISANEAEAGEDQPKVVEVISAGGSNDPVVILVDDDDDG
nr:hypothetical protein [Lachnospiraceae bacterium]